MAPCWLNVKLSLSALCRSWYFSLHIICILLAVAMPVKPRHLRLKEQQESCAQDPVQTPPEAADSTYVQKEKTSWVGLTIIVYIIFPWTCVGGRGAKQAQGCSCWFRYRNTKWPKNTVLFGFRGGDVNESRSWIVFSFKGSLTARTENWQIQKKKKICHIREIKTKCVFTRSSLNCLNCHGVQFSSSETR